MKNLFWKKRFLKLVSFILVILIIVVCIINLFVSINLKKQILSSFQNKATNDYSIQIGTIHSNILTGNFSVSDIGLNSIDKKKISCNSFNISSIKIQNLGIISLFFRKKIILNKLSVNDAEIKINIETEIKTKKDSMEFSIYNLIKNKYTSAQINKIEIENTSFMYYENEDSIPVISFYKGNIQMDKFKVDSTTTGSRKTLFGFNDFQFTIKNIAFATKDKMYTILSSSLSFSNAQKKIEIDSINVKPNYDKYEFGKRNKEQTDRIDLKIANLKIADADFNTLFNKKEFKSSKIIIADAHAHIFRDKHIPSIKRHKLSIQELVRKVPLNLKIDSLLISNSSVTYEEHKANSINAASIAFKKMDAAITGISNFNYAVDDSLNVDASAYLNGKGKIEISLAFPLASDTESFSCKGSLRKMELEDLNTFLKDNAFVYATNGTIDSFSFHFKAGEYLSKGKLTFMYHDLRVAVKQKMENDTSNIVVKTKSFIANTFLIKTDNPKRNNKFKPADILYHRDPNKFIFNYCWQSILSGVKESIGIPGNKNPVDQ